jgi:hypothetical protein
MLASAADSEEYSVFSRLGMPVDGQQRRLDLLIALGQMVSLGLVYGVGVKTRELGQKTMAA